MPPPLGIRSALRALFMRPRPRLLVHRQEQPRKIGQTQGLFQATNTSPPSHDAPRVPRWMAESSEGADPSNSTKTNSGIESQTVPTANQLALNQLQLAAYGLNPFDPAVEGHKYGLPDLPLPPQMNLKHRYDPVVLQMTKLLMRDGKLAKAQRDMAMILNYLRTSPVPKTNPARPLVPSAPSAEHLPFNPIQYLECAIDSVAPLIRIRQLKGMAGGGRSLEVPMPMTLRQRRRTAIQWILDVVEKKKSKGSGRAMFPHRVAEELVAIVEGRSSVWEKRMQTHKQGTSSRANVQVLINKTRKR